MMMAAKFAFLMMLSKSCNWLHFAFISVFSFFFLLLHPLWWYLSPPSLLFFFVFIFMSILLLLLLSLLSLKHDLYTPSNLPLPILSSSCAHLAPPSPPISSLHPHPPRRRRRLLLLLLLLACSLFPIAISQSTSGSERRKSRRSETFEVKLIILGKKYDFNPKSWLFISFSLCWPIKQEVGVRRCWWGHE